MLGLGQKGVPALFCGYRELLKSITNSYNSSVETTELEILQPVFDAEVLVIDELGASKMSEWVAETVALILNTRYNDKRTTILTTNYPDLPPGESSTGVRSLPGAVREETLGDRIGERMRSRLQEMCVRVEMRGPDYPARDEAGAVRLRKGTMARRNLENENERKQAKAELEALLFAASRPLSAALIAKRLYLEENEAAEMLGWFQEELRDPSRGLQLRDAAGKWRLETKPELEDVIAGERVKRGEKPLTEQALEALAVVALKQPVTTEEVTAIRGTESYQTIETLRRHKLIAKVEPRGAEGKAARWRTTQHFLDLFDLADLKELYKEGRIEAAFKSVYAPDSLSAGPE